MTENEAINVLKMVEAHGCLVIEAKVMAIKALEEIQQYRELGTVEEILKVFNNQREIISMQHKTVKQYRAIGTVEEFKAFKLGRLGNKGFITIGQTIEEFKEEIRNKAIDEFCEKLCDAFCENSFQETVSGIKGVSILTVDGLVEIAWNLAEDMKGVRNERLNQQTSSN